MVFQKTKPSDRKLVSTNSILRWLYGLHFPVIFFHLCRMEDVTLLVDVISEVFLQHWDDTLDISNY